MIAMQLRDLGIKARLIGTDGSLSPQLATLGGEAVEGMTLYGMFDALSSPTPQATEFVKAYAEKYRQHPSAWAALGYDTALAVKAGASAAQAKGPINRESLNTALSAVQGLPGATGPVGFQADGDRAGTLYYFSLRNGRFVLADPQ